MKRILFFLLGCITFSLGTIGILLPLLPTVPFYLATGFFWLNSSKKMHDYFVNTKWYHYYVQELMIEKQLNLKQQRKALAILFLMLLLPFILVPNLIMRICLIVVFISHCLFFHFYFSKKTKNTIKKRSEDLEL